MLCLAGGDQLVDLLVVDPIAGLALFEYIEDCLVAYAVLNAPPDFVEVLFEVEQLF